MIKFNSIILSPTRIFKDILNNSLSKRGWATNQCETAHKYFLNCGIQHFNNLDIDGAYTCFTKIILDDNAGDDMKAIAHLYIAKVQMYGSSSSNWLAIINLRRAKALFDSIERTQFDNEHRIEMKKQFDKINIIYGGLEEYQNILKTRLETLGIFSGAPADDDTGVVAAKKVLAKLKSLRSDPTF